MADHRDDAALVRASEIARLSRGGIRRIHAVAAALKNDGWHADRRLLCELALDGLERGVAGDVAETVTIGMDYDVDEIGIVERDRRAVVSGIVKFPIR